MSRVSQLAGFFSSSVEDRKKQREIKKDVAKLADLDDEGRFEMEDKITLDYIPELCRMIFANAGNLELEESDEELDYDSPEVLAAEHLEALMSEDSNGMVQSHLIHHFPSSFPNHALVDHVSYLFTNESVRPQSLRKLSACLCDSARENSKRRYAVLFLKHLAQSDEVMHEKVMNVYIQILDSPKPSFKFPDVEKIPELRLVIYEIIQSIVSMPKTPSILPVIPALRRAHMRDIVELNVFQRWPWGTLLCKLGLNIIEEIDSKLDARTALVLEGRRAWTVLSHRKKNPDSTPPFEMKPTIKCWFYHCDKLETPTRKFTIRCSVCSVVRYCSEQCQDLDPHFEICDPEAFPVKSDLNRCENCLESEKKRKSFWQCSGCQQVFYCSEWCQNYHWRRGGHKELCKTLAKNDSSNSPTKSARSSDTSVKQNDKKKSADNISTPTGETASSPINKPSSTSHNSKDASTTLKAKSDRGPLETISTISSPDGHTIDIQSRGEPEVPLPPPQQSESLSKSQKKRRRKKKKKKQSGNSALSSPNCSG
eukprot:39500_1